MKKIVYSLVTAVAVVAAMVSCSHKENEVVDKTGYQYRFVIAETDTRATLDDQGVLWEVGDQVGVFLGEQLNSTNAPVNATDDPKTIEVTSTEPVATVYAYYPYNAANEAGATTAEVVFPASQAGGSVSAMPMAGLPTEVMVGGEGSANGVIHFVNLGSVIDFRIYSSGEADYSSETVESVTFRAPGMAVSGTATLDLTQVSYDESTKTVTVPEMTMTGGAGTTYATVTQLVGVTASKTDATTPIYLVVAPGTYTGTIVVNTNAASYTFSYENREFKRNGLRKYNLNLNNATREALTKTYTNIGTSELSEGVYLLGAYDSSSNGDGVGTYICWVPNTADGANTGSTVISHIKYSSSDISSISSDGLENRSADITGSEVEVIKAGDDWLVKVKKTGKYLYYSETGGIGFTTEAANAGHTWEFGTGSNNSKRRFVYPSNFEFYHSGREKGFLYGSNKGAFNFRFYKLSGSTKSQSIWFEQPEGTVLAPDAVLTYDLASAEPFVAPVLKGVKTTVLYESSNSAIASVDAISGAVTFGGTQRGTVTITATAAGESGYASATASYKIDVSDSSIPVSVYNKVTSVSDLEPGAKYLLVFEGLAGDTDGDGNPKVFSAVLNANGDQFAKATSSALDVTIANGVIESSDFDNCQFTLEAGYYLKGDQANKYIYPGSVTSGYSTSSVMLAESTASHQLTIAFNNGIAEIANGGRYLVWSTSSHYFSCNTEVSGQSSTGICLYKLYDSRQAQTLVFTGSEAKYDLGIEEWTVAVPTVSGNETFPLTWTSSDETVATVDASGNVSPIAKGTTIITATAPANETYKSGSASFTVTVFDSRVPPYYKVDEIENGKEYIIVSNGYALLLNGTTVSASAVAEGDAEGEVKFEASSNALWTATVSGTSVKVKNGNYYLRTSSNSASFSISNRDSNNAIVYSSEDNTVKVGNYYLNYSGSSFSLNNSSDNTSAAFYSRIKPLPSLKFDKAGVTYDLAINDWTGAMPVLSPADADVSYGYNGDDGIIKSISATGVITLEDNPEKGQVTVTATANTPGDYNIASASYTITVIDSNEIPTYTKVSEITSGATYLIVSTDINNYNGKGQKRAFAGDTSGSAVEVDGTSGTITGDYSACEFVITAEGEAYALNGPNGYVTGQSSTDPYIQVSETKVTMSLTDAATLKAASSSDGLVTDAFYFYYLKGSSTEALYLNTNGKFKIGGSGRKYGVYLYKKND